MKYLLSGIFFCMVGLSAQANDFNVNEFMQKNCMSCHGSETYTRADRNVKDLAKLEAQVRLCDANLGTGLFDEDIPIVVEHLNQNYYHF